MHTAMVTSTAPGAAAGYPRAATLSHHRRPAIWAGVPCSHHRARSSAGPRSGNRRPSSHRAGRTSQTIADLVKMQADPPCSAHRWPWVTWLCRSEHQPLRSDSTAGRVHAFDPREDLGVPLAGSCADPETCRRHLWMPFIRRALATRRRQRPPSFARAVQLPSAAVFATSRSAAASI